MRHAHILLVAALMARLLAGAPPAAAEATDRSVVQLVREAEAASVAGRHDVARTLARRAVARDPAWPPAWRQYGLALLRGGRAAEAVAAFRQGLELAEDDALAARGLAQALAQTGRIDEAVAVLNTHLLHVPDDTGAWRDLAAWQARSGRLDAAVEALQRVVALEPAHAAAWRELGTLHARQARPEAAVAALETSLRWRPEDPATLRDLGWALWPLDRRDEAVRRLEAAVRLGVAESDRVVLRVVAQLAEENAPDAAIAFHRATRPGAPLADSAVRLVREGRVRAAAPLLAAAWEAGETPGRTGLYLAYARAAAGLEADLGRTLTPFVEQAATADEEDLDLALETLRLAHTDPAAPELAGRLEAIAGARPVLQERVTSILEKAADARRARREDAAALALYRRVLERDPNRTSWAWAYRLATAIEPDGATGAWLAERAQRASSPAVRAGIEGIRADRAGDLEQAAARLAESLRLDPDQPALRPFLFLAHLKRGRTAEARDEARELERRVRDGDALLRPVVAEALTRLGELEDALAHWRHLHLASPDRTHYGIETAHALYRLGEADEALDLLREMTATRPDAQVYEWKAEIATALDRPALVAAFAAEGLANAPSDALLRYRAESAERLGDPAVALDSADRLLARDPGRTPAALLRGRALTALGREEEARHHYRALLDRNPLLLPALSAMRDDALRSGRFPEAVEFARAGLRLQPESPDAQRRYAHALAQDDRFRPALSLMRRAARHPPADAVAVLVYRIPTTHPYPGHNAVRQVAAHVERLAGEGYRFVHAADLGPARDGNRRVMLVLLDPDAGVVEALDPVLAAWNARAVYAAHSGLPSRTAPGFPVSDRLRPLFETGRWQPAASGPASLPRPPIADAVVTENPRAQSARDSGAGGEAEADHAARVDRLLAEAARQLTGEPARLFVYPAGDFGQRSLDGASGAPDAGAGRPAPPDGLPAMVGRHFTHALFFDDSGFWLPDTDPLRIPARLVPARWDADTLLEHLVRAQPRARAQLEYGRILYWHGQHEAAIRAFARAGGTGAEPAAVAFNWGLAAGRQGDARTALLKLREARLLAPDDERVLAALERVEDGLRPRLSGVLRQTADNENRRSAQAGLQADLFADEAARLGLALDRNVWRTGGLGRESGLRAGIHARVFPAPQVWIDGRIWRMDLQDLPARWGGRAALRAPYPMLNGHVEAAVRREEIPTVEALRAGIDARIAALYSYMRLADTWDLFAHLSRNARTDGNTTDMIEGRLLYRLREWPYAGAGWRFRFADSDRDPPEYWAPDGLAQHQLHLSLRGQWGRLRSSCSGDIGYARERDTGWRAVAGLRVEAGVDIGANTSVHGLFDWFEGPRYRHLAGRVGVTRQF